MRLREFIPRLLIIAAVGAVIWFGLGLFTNTAEDSGSTAVDNRTSQHDSIQDL